MNPIVHIKTILASRPAACPERSRGASDQRKLISPLFGLSRKMFRSFVFSLLVQRNAQGRVFVVGKQQPRRTKC